MPKKYIIFFHIISIVTFSTVSVEHKPQIVTLETSNGIKLDVPTKHINKMKTIANMLEDCHKTEKICVELPDISVQTLSRIIKHLERHNTMHWDESIKEIIPMIKAIDYLNIPTLLTQSIKQLACILTQKKISDYMKTIHVDLERTLPYWIQNKVAKKIISSSPYLKSSILKRIKITQSITKHPPFSLGLPQSINLYSYDKPTILASQGKHLLLWDVNNYKNIHYLEGHVGLITRAIMLKNLIASASKDSTIKLWNKKTLVCKKTLIGHSDEITDIYFDGTTLVSSSRDKTIKLWDTENFECKKTLHGHTGWVNHLCSTPESILSGSDDKTIKIWDATTGVCLNTIPIHMGHITAMCTAKNKLFVGTLAGWMYLIDTKSKKIETMIRAHNKAIRSLKAYETGIMSTSDDQTIKMWNSSSAELNRIIKGQFAYPIDKHHIMAAEHSGRLSLFNTKTNRYIRTFYGHQAPVNSLIAIKNKIFSTDLNHHSIERNMIRYNIMNNTLDSKLHIQQALLIYKIYKRNKHNKCFKIKNKDILEIYNSLPSCIKDHYKKESPKYIKLGQESTKTLNL